MSDTETNLSCTPPQLREIADNAVINLLPKKSKAVYEKCYHQFELWAVQNNVNTISENILLAYFELQGKNKKSSTLWSMYSMLRSCFSIYKISIYKNTDISKYIKLRAYLKRFSEGYENYEPI
ncbi:hypothetical protein QE152_g40977 [Popillia japonica]|uniref:Uncharacterized protein n=1 Tax=Popillia japonica TaxID=7064 RepID=A0AAW1HEZ9_POPJA